MSSWEEVVEPVGGTGVAGLDGVTGGAVHGAAGCDGGLAVWFLCVPDTNRNVPIPASPSTMSANASRRWRDVRSMSGYFFRRSGRSQNGVGAGGPVWLLPLCPPLA